jgi:hypothetical protein
MGELVNLRAALAAACARAFGPVPSGAFTPIRLTLAFRDRGANLFSISKEQNDNVN